MQIIVTLGNGNGDSVEQIFDLEGPIMWLGVEVETVDPESRTGRTTILRLPFSTYEQGEMA